MTEEALPFHGGGIFFSRWCWENGVSMWRGDGTRSLTPHSKWIKDLNVKDKTNSLIEENITRVGKAWGRRQGWVRRGPWGEEGEYI